MPPPVPTRTTVLVIGGSRNPATPFAGAQHLTAALGGRARLLTWTGAGHTIYHEGNACVDDTVNHYLLNGQLPPAGTICRP
jgi:pimeloyl-ACP methyl ester carboxylesterase